jgi:hypothetical protein
MNPNPTTHNRSTDRPPLLVYGIMAGLVLWLVLASWGFAGSGYTDVALVVITGFFVVVTMIPFLLWRTWRAHRESADSTEARLPLADWISSSFETWQGRMKGANALVEMTLPIAAAAIGMTAFAIVFHYAALHASA